MGAISSCCKSEEKVNSSGTSMKDDDDDDEGFLDTPMKQKLLEVTPPSTTKLDRLGDRTKMSAIVMQEINAILRKFATDTIFQRHLARPAVQEAFDHWQGVKEDGNHRHEIKADIGVAAIYPQLRFLESVCTRAGVRVPLALVRQGKPQLDDTYSLL